MSQEQGEEERKRGSRGGGEKKGGEKEGRREKESTECASKVKSSTPLFPLLLEIQYILTLKTTIDRYTQKYFSAIIHTSSNTVTTAEASARISKYVCIIQRA